MNVDFESFNFKLIGAATNQKTGETENPQE